MNKINKYKRKIVKKEWELKLKGKNSADGENQNARLYSEVEELRSYYNEAGNV